MNVNDKGDCVPGIRMKPFRGITELHHRHHDGIGSHRENACMYLLPTQLIS